MATVEKLKAHISKAKKDLAEIVKKAENPKLSLEVRKKKKKVKRLSRKVSKIAYIEKKLAEKGAKKKKAGE